MPALHLAFDCSFPYSGTESDFRPMPRLPLSIASPADANAIVGVEPVLDTGADYTVFDGRIAQYLGWREQDIAGRAEDTYPIFGVRADGHALVGYRHRFTCLISLGRQFAALQIRAFVTTPNTLSTPVLGRRDFFRQVDFALVEAEQRFYLRFRDRSVLQESW